MMKVVERFSTNFKPTDLDLWYFKKKDISGFISTRVKSNLNQFSFLLLQRATPGYPGTEASYNPSQSRPLTFPYTADTGPPGPEAGFPG